MIYHALRWLLLVIVIIPCMVLAFPPMLCLALASYADEWLERRQYEAVGAHWVPRNLRL